LYGRSRRPDAARGSDFNAPLRRAIDGRRPGRPAIDRAAVGPHAGQTDPDGRDGGLEVPDSARRPAPAACAATPDVGADGAPALTAAEGPHAAAADWRHGVVQGPAALPVAAAPGKPVHRQTGERTVPALPVPAGGD